MGEKAHRGLGDWASDDANPSQTRHIPRLPPTWNGFTAQDWPILTSAGLARAEIQVERSKGSLNICLSVSAGSSIPSLSVRLPQDDGWIWHTAKDVSRLDLT